MHVALVVDVVVERRRRRVVLVDGAVVVVDGRLAGRLTEAGGEEGGTIVGTPGASVTGGATEDDGVESGASPVSSAVVGAGELSAADGSAGADVVSLMTLEATAAATSSPLTFPKSEPEPPRSSNARFAAPAAEARPSATTKAVPIPATFLRSMGSFALRSPYVRSIIQGTEAGETKKSGSGKPLAKIATFRAL